MELIALAVVLVFAMVWYYPVVRRQQAIGGYIRKRDLILPLVLGLIPVMILAIVCQIGVGWLFYWLGIQDTVWPYMIAEAFISAALIEELIKYGAARLTIRRFPTLRKIDIILMFGAVGLGFELLETFMLGSPLGAIFRGLFLGHVMYQFIMGHYFFESVRAKNRGDLAAAKKYKVLAFLVPILLHGLNDLFAFVGEMYSGLTTDAAGPASVVCFLLVVAVELVGLIWGLKLAKREPEVEVTLK